MSDNNEEADVFADTGYQGVSKREETQGIETNWHMAMRPGRRKVLDKATPMGAIMDELEHVRVRYLGLIQNTAQLQSLFALSNLWMVNKLLLNMA